MASFNDAIQKMLWPEKRDKDPILGDKVPGFIYRTTATSYIKVAPGYLPEGLEKLLGWGDWFHRLFPWLFSEGHGEDRSDPQGHAGEFADQIWTWRRTNRAGRLLLKMIEDLKQVEGASDEEAAKVFKNLVPDLLKLSKCPDFVVNKGHYFGTGFFKDEPPLSDDDKWALIEYLKTFWKQLGHAKAQHSDCRLSGA